jgi:hypothetical protein
MPTEAGVEAIEESDDINEREKLVPDVVLLSAG